MSGTWYLGIAWEGAVFLGEEITEDELEDTTPKPRGEIYKPAIQAPCGTGAAIGIDYESPGD